MSSTLDSTTPTPEATLRAPMTPIRRLILPALSWSVAASCILLGLVAIATLIVRTANSQELDLAHLAIWSVSWGALTAVVLFGVRLFVISRSFADRSFTTLGVMATFFGLAMLSIFFLQLGVEAVEWFTVTPELIARNNSFLEERVKNAEADIEIELAALKDEKAFEMKRAATPERKKEIQDLFENHIQPERAKALALTAAECRIARDRGVRTDTSPLGLLSFFLTRGPSNEAQNAGIYPALVGSLLVSLITIVLAVPVGVGAAIYLEEYRSNSRLSRIIQVNINNLAGVPSVVYGILGGLVFVELLFKPLELRFDWIAARNVLGGGMTLALLTLPVVIVAAQEAIRAVPNSIRQGAYALGATQWQTISRQVLPLAWPGIMTGTILALSRAIGEAAPLVLFGALLFVNQTPGLFSRFTVLPMQIFGWADRPSEVLDGRSIEIWRANAAMGCIILLIVLLGLNAIAIVLRNRAQRKMKW